MLKFSVVTPSYNQVQYIQTCLRSVAGQQYSNYEHIVVDGGSTDGTVELLSNISNSDPHLKYISEPDNGQADAVNKGLAMVTGDIVVWINSDDYFFSPATFQTVAELFENNRDADAVYGGLAWVDKDGHLLHVRIPPAFDWSLLTRVSYIGNSNFFFRQRLAKQFKVDTRFHYVLDHEYVLRLTQSSKVLRTSHVLTCFRVQPESKTQTMAEAAKNLERDVRDLDLGIRRNKLMKFRTWIDRIYYRFQLWQSDRTYLPMWREHPPYEKFLNDEKR